MTYVTSWVVMVVTLYSVEVLELFLYLKDSLSLKSLRKKHCISTKPLLFQRSEFSLGHTRSALEVSASSDLLALPAPLPLKKAD